MECLHPVMGAQVFHQPTLLVDALELVLGLDEADRSARAAERGEMGLDLVEEQLARVGSRSILSRGSCARRSGTIVSLTTSSTEGTRCSPPMPVRLGSTNLSVSFQLGLV